jgi:hypothetical protein
MNTARFSAAARIRGFDHAVRMCGRIGNGFETGFSRLGQDGKKPVNATVPRLNFGRVHE